jgi:tetratricopeptide (TPR) repeat protein
MIIFAASVLTVFTLDSYQLNQEGRALLEQHRYSAAAQVFRLAVDRAGSELGPRDPATAMMLRNLALADIYIGDPASAEQSAKLAYAILVSHFGSADPSLTPVLNVLAECYASTSRIAEAQQASEQAVAIGPSAGPHYGTALHNLGVLREFSGDLDGAATLYRRAIAVKIATLGEAHPYVSLSRSYLRRVQHGEHLAASARPELAAE